MPYLLVKRCFMAVFKSHGANSTRKTCGENQKGSAAAAQRVKGGAEARSLPGMPPPKAFLPALRSTSAIASGSFAWYKTGQGSSFSWVVRDARVSGRA